MASLQKKQRSKSVLEKAILTTLLYSDIFHFPLTKEEMWKYLLVKKNVSKTAFEKALAEFPSHDGYYCLPGEEAIIKERKANLEELLKKKKLAVKAASFLSYLPTVLFIGLSGGVAVGNVTKDDDIDFFIITKQKTLFITRLWILAVLEMLGMRRKRNDKHAADKICVNLLIEETALVWPARKRDLYTAHEIVQVVPLFARREMYARFIAANKWIEKFLPNAVPLLPHVSNHWQRSYLSLSLVGFLVTLYPFEALVRKIQKYSMNKHRSHETIVDTFLAFHPLDYRTKTLKSLHQKAQLLGLLTKD